MRDAVKGYLTLAAGLTEVTRQRATAAARALVSQGEATAEQVSQLVDDLLAQSRQNREAVQALTTYEVDRALGRLRLASADEVTQLTDRVRALEAAVRRISDAAQGSGATDSGTSSGGAAATGAKPPSGGAAGTRSKGAAKAPAKGPAKAPKGAAKKSAGTTGTATPHTRSAASAPRGRPSPAEKTATGSES